MFAKKTPAIILCSTLFLAACGSDSTAPNSLDANAALQSLALGLNQLGGTETPTTMEASAAFSAIAPLLDKVTVNINGVSQGMYAIGVRESFPDGTCEETLFIDPQFPPTPGVCTPPQLGVTILMWQTSSATQPPDKLLLLAADVGSSNFDFSTSNAPGLALYVEGQGQDKVWLSDSGTMTSSVTASNQTCSIPLPPYAKSGTCSFASFTEQASVVLSDFSLSSSAKTVTLTIPSVTHDGLWLAITEVQPVPLTSNVGLSLSIPGRLLLRAQVPRRAAPGMSRISIPR